MPSLLLTVVPMLAAAHSPGGRSRGRRASTIVTIEAPTRFDALDLVRTVPAANWFLVARGVSRWDVCVHASPRSRRALETLVDAAQEWADRRELDSVVHLPDRDVQLHGRRPPA